MKIWKNTSTLDGFDDGLTFTKHEEEADIILMGGKGIELKKFTNLKGIFRAGIGKENVPESEALKKGIIVKLPSKKTVDIIFDETASFTCGLILRMLYNNVGTLDPWFKEPRRQLLTQNLLVIGFGQIGRRVTKLMKSFMTVSTYDILQNKENELKKMIENADCISIHVPKNLDNISYIDAEKLSWIKSGAVLINTARGAIVDEDALYEKIKEGKISAAFDVYWEEPYRGKLKKFHPSSFFMTPHIASTCGEFLKGCRNDLDKLIFEISEL